MKENVRNFESERFSKKENTRIMVISAILIALGGVLHTIVPGAGIKPDFLLACMFVAITIAKNAKQVFVITFVSGILAALTTGFPAGQIPSIIDKITSGFIFLMLFKLIGKKRENMFFKSSLYFISTLFSGVFFLTCCLTLGKLLGLADTMAVFKNGFIPLVTLIVLPTAVANFFFGGLLSKVLDMKKY